MNKAIFLDRDGIINLDKGYVYRYEDIEWMKGIFEIIKFANDNNFKVVVLTNQSGVDRGMYQESDVIKLHKQMTNYLNDKNLNIDDWYYCIEMDSAYRKPRPGMILDAAKKHNIDLNRSIMIGDKVSDVLEIDGPFTILLRGAYPIEISEKPKIKIKNSLDEVFMAIKEITATWI